MRTLHHASKTFADELAAFCRGAIVPKEIADSVTAILADVRARGDEAVAYYAAKFDGAKLRARDFRVSANDLAAAAKRLPAAELRALSAAHENILAFNKQGVPQAWTAKNKQGAIVGEKFDPIRRVGLYVPGGEVPLVSTVLMTVTLAKIAGCPEIAVFTPSNAEGKVADGMLAALHFLGVEEVYRVGGVQAIGAMAYGTTTIPAVDKVFGPGNAYVCEAKRQVFGTVGVDSLPGPSEVMIIADETANVIVRRGRFAGAGRAWFGPRKNLPGCDVGRHHRGGELGNANAASIISRSEKTQRVLEQGFLAIEVETLGQAAEIANYVAPEHLELLVRRAAAAKLTAAITTAGAIMIGNHTPTALGDFIAGPEPCAAHRPGRAVFQRDARGGFHATHERHSL